MEEETNWFETNFLEHTLVSVTAVRSENFAKFSVFRLIRFHFMVRVSLFPAYWIDNRGFSTGLLSNVCLCVFSDEGCWSCWVWSSVPAMLSLFGRVSQTTVNRLPTTTRPAPVRRLLPSVRPVGRPSTDIYVNSYLTHLSFPALHDHWEYSQTRTNVYGFDSNKSCTKIIKWNQINLVQSNPILTNPLYNGCPVKGPVAMNKCLNHKEIPMWDNLTNILYYVIKNNSTENQVPTHLLVPRSSL